MSDNIPFNYNGSPIRRTEKDGKTWFVAADTLKALGISAKVSTYLNRLHGSEKGDCVFNTLGGPQSLKVITESGLYGLTFMSRKTEAIRFRLWVTGTVIPSIRKTGEYVAEELKKQNEALKHDIQLYQQRDGVFGNKVRPGTISKANGRYRVLPRSGTMCAPRTRHVRIDTNTYQPELFNPETFQRMMQYPATLPSEQINHPIGA